MLEGRFHLFGHRAELGTDEDAGGHVERQSLDRRKDLDRSVFAIPTFDAAYDHRVHLGRVVTQDRTLESRMHDSTVHLVLFTVHEQQSVGEDASHDRHPRPAGREEALLVEQDQAIGVGPE